MSSQVVDTTVPTVLALEGSAVAADWGSTALLRDLLGHPLWLEGVQDQVAEIWFGAHERNPSSVTWAGVTRPVRDVDAIEDPTFLVKFIAVAAPLSVQVHPDDATAAAGFAAEEAAAARGATDDRRFADASGKPELLRAITPMRVLCGLRSAGASRDLLARIAGSGLELPLSLLAQGDANLGTVISVALRSPQAQVDAWLAALEKGASVTVRAVERDAHAVDAATARMARLILDLGARHPGDAGVLVALLLEDRDLSPGESIYVAPGVPHAYLSGLGVEVMASSDNVLRGGMTSKLVDVDAFLEVLDASVGGGIRVGTLSQRVTDGPGWRRLLTPSEAFVIDEAMVDGALRVERTGTGPAIVLCLGGELTVLAADGSEAMLERGAAVLLNRGLEPVEVRGSGELLHVRAGQSHVRPAPAA